MLVYCNKACSIKQDKHATHIKFTKCFRLSVVHHYYHERVGSMGTDGTLKECRWKYMYIAYEGTHKEAWSHRGVTSYIAYYKT